MPSPDIHLLICRPEFDATLAAEAASHGLATKPIAPGVRLARGTLPERPLVFERQRLPHATHLPASRLQPLDETIGQAVAERLIAEPSLWTVHAFAMPEDAPGLPARAEGLARNLTRLVRKVDPVLAKREVDPGRLIRRGRGLVVQLLLLQDGLWWSVAPVERLSDAWPGGVHRMKFDEGAPSRSYLKLEEAFERMGREPKAGELAVDLGAAPGGWTYALARRGCDVIAVDNGPMRLEVATPGRVDHRQEDGISFSPPPGARLLDWLVADMLIPPGAAFGLLKRWTAPGLARRLVVNVKLPQEHPWPALAPILDYLEGLRDWRIRVRQLYHDRREVTVMAEHGTDAPGGHPGGPS